MQSTLGQRFRVWMLVLTMLVVVSPLASAQSTPEAAPVEETPVVVETPADTGEQPEISTPVDEPVATEDVVDETTPEATDEVVDGTTPAATETETPADPVDVIGEVLPETSPTSEQRPVSAARDVELLATRTLVITLETSDEGGTVSAGTEACVWNSYESCQDWLGEPLTFTLYRSSSEYRVYVPGESVYAGAEGVITVPSGQTVNRTVKLQKKAAVEVSLAPGTVPAGTEVCLDSSDEGCQDWAGAPLSFKVMPGVVEYVVYVAPESGFAMAVGSFTVGAGETVQKTITLEAPATVNVTIVTADGGPVPDWVNIYMHPSVEGWQDWEGDPLPFKVTPGEVSYEIDVPSQSAYSDVSGTIIVTTGETVDLTVTLEPKGPATLRVYVTTADGAYLVAGSQVCVNMPSPDFGEPVVDLCQTVTGSYVNFSIGQGEAEITVTPPDGSGYESETGYFWTQLGETTRAVFELEAGEIAFNAHVDVNVRANDTSAENPLDLDSVGLCLYHGEFNLFAGCEYVGAATANEDGSLSFHLDVHGGTYNYYVATDTGVWIQGTLTAVSNETTEINVVLPLVDGQEKATLIVNVVTVDGSPIPEGILVCVIDIIAINENEADIEEFCRPWTGAAESFTLSPTLAVYLAASMEESDYLPTFEYVVLSPGETREVTITLYPYDLETTITHTVSDEAPQSGDTVTYTIRAYGQAPQFMTMAAYEPEIDFQIDDVLPVELMDVSVSCAGMYSPSIPGSCYELEDGVLTVFGEYAMGGIFDITITVTGTIVGEPGTVVSNTACVNQEFRGIDRVGANKIASTSLYGLALQQVPGDMPCATAILTIAQADQVPATPTPTDPATPEPTDPATPGVTPSPTAPATPGVTPSPTSPATSTPAPGEPTATAPSDPAAPVVTGLPSTGTSSAMDRSTMLLASMVAALSLMAAGCAVHVRFRNR